MKTEEDLIKADDLAAKAAKGYADYVYSQKIYEGMCKDFLAALKMEIRSEMSGQKVSESELETRARANPKWLEFRSTQMQYLRDAGRAEILYKNAERRWKTVQSCLSLRKAEVNRFGG